ncbi:MFS transporter [Caproicibacterium sp. BJN0003]|uniref:MFS transporter n=1 Tax=Caproicibacterium sp. BJN0003 TaxID=2994078 RepID=UPI00224E5DAF|nr:MFS transporter [Caproicibacterium sp. BJN0003]UZT81596.1 MFS transporter [Caproicibacterium sp. BJN0003]
MIMISQMNVLALGFLLPIFLQNGVGSSSLTAALILLPGAAANAVMSLWVGSLLKKHRATTFFLAGYLLQSVMLIVFLKAAYTVGMVICFYLAFMFGAGLIVVAAQTNALNRLSAENNADGSAIMNTLQQTGGAIGTALASSFLTPSVSRALSNGLTKEQAYADGLRGSLGFFLGLTIFGLVLALLSRKGKYILGNHE